MKLYSVEEMSGLLGLSVHTIYAKTSRRNRAHVRADLPPWIKLGKLVRFPDSDYREWLAKQQRHYAEETSS